MTDQELIDVLQAKGITDIVGLPDNTSGALLSAAAGPRRVAVTREGEAFAVASGLWIGGARPAVVIQNTGLLESGDALRGTAVRMGIPLPCLVTYRGYATLTGRHPSPAALTDPTVDSVAVLTEPTLEAWGIPWVRLGSARDLATLVEQCRHHCFPGVALIDRLEGAQ